MVENCFAHMKLRHCGNAAAWHVAARLEPSLTTAEKPAATYPPTFWVTTLSIHLALSSGRCGGWDSRGRCNVPRWMLVLT